MVNTANYIDDVGNIINDLEKAGYQPVMVGGMALVLLGSQRVTKDFDFVIRELAREQETLIKILYKRGFELASKLNQHGEIIATLNNQKIANIRLKLDKPESAYFFDPKTGLRLDLLFDFPIAADELASRANKKKVRSYTFHIADKKDLLRLKKIATNNRNRASDQQDLEFLKSLN